MISSKRILRYHKYYYHRYYKYYYNYYHYYNLKIQSHVVHAIALACIEPYVVNINDSIDYFILNYHMQQSSALPSSGWYSTYRGEQLTQTFIKIFGSENRQLACSCVCTLSNQPGTQSPIHGGRQSPGLTNAHLIWEKETKSVKTPTSVAAIDVNVNVNVNANVFIKVVNTSPRAATEDGVAPERPLKKSKFDDDEKHPEPLVLKFNQVPYVPCMNDDQGLEWTLFDAATSHGYSDSISNFGMCQYFDEPVEQELFDLFLEPNFDASSGTEIASMLDNFQL